MKKSKVKLISLYSKVIDLYSNGVLFDNGLRLCSFHPKQGCEEHFLSLHDLTLDDFKDLEFDLTNENFFELIEDYGIALKPIKGFPVRIPAYGVNNGCYSSDLYLVLSHNDSSKIFDIYDCQERNTNKAFNVSNKNNRYFYMPGSQLIKN